MKPSRISEQRMGRAPLHSAISMFHFCVVFFLAGLATSVQAREKDALQYGEGLIVNIPVPTDEVAKVVEEVAANGIIRGTKEYQKDEYIRGAEAATATPVFPAWTDSGKVFYKVRKQALNPWNFKNSADVGTLAVRYVVQPQGEKNTVLRIDALFVEDNRHSVHSSNGSVESSEYKDIQDHIAQIELMKKETAEAEELKREHVEKQNFGLDEKTELLSTPKLESGESSSLAGDERATMATTPDTYCRGPERNPGAASGQAAASGGTPGEEAGGSAEIRSVSHGEHTEVAGCGDGCADCDCDAVLVWGGDS